MANNIAYEAIVVGATAVGPTEATVQGANSVCAIFYLDPQSAGDVRYRADRTDPTASVGLPIRPGRHLVVAGKGDIMNARFISRSGGRCVIHALYYDQVDVVAFDMGEGTQTMIMLHGIEDLLTRLLDVVEAMHLEIAALRLGLMGSGVAHEFSPADVNHEAGRESILRS